MAVRAFREARKRVHDRAELFSMPFVALVTAYVYFDARARFELEPVEHVDELPAEIALEAS